MEKVSNNFCFFLAVILLFSSGCTKNVAGPQGDPGTPGLKGNLVQKSVGPLTVSSASWTFDGSNWNVTIFVGEINEEVISKGQVKGYLQVGNEWRSLPYALGDLFTQMSVANTQVRLKRSKIHGGPPARPETTIFRFVVFSPKQ